MVSASSDLPMPVMMFWRSSTKKIAPFNCAGRKKWSQASLSVYLRRELPVLRNRREDWRSKAIAPKLRELYLRVREVSAPVVRDRALSDDLRSVHEALFSVGTRRRP